MREIYEKVEVLETEYTKQEIDKIVSEHTVKIIEYCKELELRFSGRGLYNTYETMRVLFDLRNFEMYTQICGQGLPEDIVEGIKEGFIVEVYRFRTGDLDEIVYEGLDCSIDGSEASELYSKYKQDEISEEEYYEKFEEVIQPWIDNYIKDYLDNTVDIRIDYLDTQENNDNYNYWDED